MFHFKVVTDWIDEFLRTNLGEGWTLLIGLFRGQRLRIGG
jgi:hypothetical protein